MLKIGDGYDSTYKKRKSYSMFKQSLSTVESYPSSFKFNSYVFTSNEDYRKKFSTSMNLGVKVPLSPGLNFMINFSDELARERDSVIYIIHAIGIKRTVSAEVDADLFPNDSRVQRAMKDLQVNPAKFLSRYGDSYVSTISYGKEIALIIKYDNNLFKKNSSLGVKGEVVSIPEINTGTVDAAMDYFSSLGVKNSACKIYFQTEGIDQTQLPKNNTSIDDWFAWLKDFEQNFNRTADEKYENNVGYELESYATTFPTETIVIMPHVRCRATYFISYTQALAAIDFYIRYYEKWLDKPRVAREFHAMRQQLDDISGYLASNINVSEGNKIQEFKELIEKLNNIELEPKLLNIIPSSEFVSSSQGKLSCQDQRVSLPSFKVPSDLPAELFAFSFVVETESKKPIDGYLSFEYSKECQVSFDTTTSNFARNLNIDAKAENSIKVPTDLKERIKNSHLAFHYEAKKSTFIDAIKEFFSCVKCSKIEEFHVHTYLWCAKPNIIQNIPSLEPLQYKKSDELDDSPKVDQDVASFKPQPLTFSLHRRGRSGVLEKANSSTSMNSNYNTVYGYGAYTYRNHSVSAGSRSEMRSRTPSHSSA